MAKRHWLFVFLFVLRWNAAAAYGLGSVGLVSAAATSSPLVQSIAKTRNMRRSSSASGAPVKTLAASRGGAAESKSDIQKKEQESLASVTFCAKTGFMAAVVGTITILLDQSKIEGGLFAFNVFQAAELTTVLHRYAFVAGLFRVKVLFEEADRKLPRLGADSVFYITRTMARIWVTSATVIVMGAMTLATSAKDAYTGNGAVFGLISSTMLDQPGSIVLALALVLVAPLTFLANKAANEAEVAGKATGSKDYAAARSMGFVAARNMRLTMGAFVVLGLTQLLTAITKTDKVAIAFGLLDVSESWIIGGLLVAYYSNFLDAVVRVTGSTDNDKPEAYLGLYESRQGFYNKIGTVFRFQSFFKVLPYVIAGVKSLLAGVN